VRILIGWSEPAIAAAGAPPRARVRAGPACRRADSVTREGGVAATPLQVKRGAQLNKSDGNVSMRHRIAIGPNRQASLQTQNYNAGAVAGAWRRRVKITSENAIQCISMRVCNEFLSAESEIGRVMARKLPTR
jgi:hypothetical protein